MCGEVEGEDDERGLHRHLQQKVPETEKSRSNDINIIQRQESQYQKNS